VTAVPDDIDALTHVCAVRDSQVATSGKLFSMLYVIEQVFRSAQIALACAAHASGAVAAPPSLPVELPVELLEHAAATSDSAHVATCATFFFHERSFETNMTGLLLGKGSIRVARLHGWREGSPKRRDGAGAREKGTERVI
jgi:hypothetical protein